MDSEQFNPKLIPMLLTDLCMLTTYQVLHSYSTTVRMSVMKTNISQIVETARSRLHCLGANQTMWFIMGQKHRSWRVFFSWFQCVHVFGSKWNRYWSWFKLFAPTFVRHECRINCSYSKVEYI